MVTTQNIILSRLELRKSPTFDLRQQTKQQRLQIESLRRTERGTHVLTDLEGCGDAVDALVAAGKLHLVDGKLELFHSSDKLIFLGDLVDRGLHSIRLVEMLVLLKKLNPDHVTLLWGNRDLNKLGLLRDLSKLERLVDTNYCSWLLARLEDNAATAAGRPFQPLITTKEPIELLHAHNTLENQVDYWLEQHSARGALEQHRRELEELRGTPVTMHQAAKDYVERIQPGGAFFEYLRLGQIIHVDRNVLYVHGGVTEVSVGIVPGHTERYADAREWVDALNTWGHWQLALVEKAVLSQGMGEHIPVKLLEYGDAIWDPTAHAARAQGVVFMNDQSVIYGMRQREDGNFRAPSLETIAYLHRAGIDTEVVGHSPSGDVPGPLKVPGFVRIMADTSFGRSGSSSTITVDKRGGVRISGRTSSGATINYRITAKNAPPVGQITEDGYTVIGRSRVDGQIRYVLSKYYDSYQIAEKVVTRKELVALKPRPAAPKESQDERQHRDVLISSLRNKDKPVQIHPFDAAVNDFIGDRIPIVVSGASKFAQFPARRENLQQMLAQIVQRLDSTRYVFLTGGTDHGVEKMLHRLARENEFKVLGFIHEGAIPGEINLVRHVVLAGARNQWVDPLLAALNVAKHKGGFAVFVGGGGVVKQGIDYAAASGIDYFLMRRDPTLEGGGTGGASAEAAPKLDAAEQRQRVFSSTCDLLDLVKRRSLAVFRTPKAQTKPLRIGVYTGSFDPVHKGHQAVVERMWTQYDLDLVYVIPDKVTSYKRMESVENRSQMVARQFRDQTWVRILPSEMQAAIGKGEMWDILRVVQQHHADAEIFNIIGSDTFAWYSKLPLEHRVPEINMLINDRHDGVVLPNTFDGKPVQNITDLDQGLSSTKVREKIRRGETPEELCAEVWKYIRDHGLYLVG